ncbi:Olfactory receptor 1I1 [Camelus dromedarius]|uniref:Olfactory receptor 1I1 n=1 Tax=Camelus dromedarius TaxID=9838 RepID=A0A5N4CK24_CAMDR|nr:Olfactory receptor 1I1 [Camelus dromedarius]
MQKGSELDGEFSTLILITTKESRHRLSVEPENHTAVSEFFLLGLSEKPEHRIFLFGLFLSMYLITIFGNLLIVLAIITDSHLHTPMYFFLSNLSLIDILFSSTTVPKMLVNLWTRSQAVPFAGCLAKMYAFHLFGTMDSFLLAVMAIDRLVAIVHPLRYLAIMSPCVCGLLVGGAMADHQPPVTHTHTNELVIFAFGIVMGISPLACILLSYTCIFWAVFKIPSAQGKWKAFSTCSSHLTMVSLFYGTIFAVYLQPASSASSQKDKAAVLMCGVVIPMLNSFIYSLRNKDMKVALRKLVGKAAPSQS